MERVPTLLSAHPRGRPGRAVSRLSAHRRHGVPRIKDVRDTMPGEAAKVLDVKPVFVPHLYRVRPSPRQFAEEGIEVGDEMPAVLVVARPETRELEHEYPHVWADVLTRFEKRSRE